MSITKEEKSRRAREGKQKFPVGWLDLCSYKRGSVRILFSQGSSDVTVFLHGDFEFSEEKHAQFWMSDDLQELAKFIRALICRYNAMIEKLNETVEKTPRIERARKTHRFEPRQTREKEKQVKREKEHRGLVSKLECELEITRKQYQELLERYRQFEPSVEDLKKEFGVPSGNSHA
jgi:hypothetical protein